MDPALYSPLPDDWTVGVADIVESTKAIANQRYKAVNMAGASVIAAVTNALEGREFPFVFGGDGASFAVSPDDLERAREALAATAIWVEEDLNLVMRVALVPVPAVRAQGLDVRVARFGPSPNLSYAMFSGGGLGWADAAMKRGEFAVPAAPPGTQPDLSGLSCRFEEIPSTRGLILSVLVVPAQGADPPAFRKVIEDIIALVERSPDAGRPVPPGGPPLRWPPAGVEYEARAARGGPLLKRRAVVLAVTLWAYVVHALRHQVGNFVPKNYVQQVVENSDFRKYDDGLRMILDCTRGTGARADAASREGRVRGDRALRPAPAGCGDDDLLHAVGDAQRPRPLHRRRPRRLCLGGDGAEGDGGLIEADRLETLACRSRVQVSPPQSAPTQPSTSQRIRTRHRDAAGVAGAVIGVVDLARPFVRTGGLHAAEQRQADHRPLLQRRIGILVVDLGLAGGGIDRVLEADDHAADAAAAFADLHPRVAGLRQPDAGRLTGALRASRWGGQQCRRDRDDESRICKP